MPSFLYVFFTIHWFYAIAAVAAAFLLTEQGWKRFVPVASVVVAVLPWCLVWLPWLGDLRYFLPPLCAILCLALMYCTMRLAWSGERVVEIALRMTAVILIGFAFAMLFLLGGGSLH